MLTFLLNIVSKCFCLLLRTSDTHSFPPPLSKEEEYSLFVRAHGGDLEARNRLIEHNLRLVAHIVKKYYTTYPDQDDLISIGTIGLIKAINTYDNSKGSRLVTYASRCIENELLMRLRQERKESREISLFEPIGTDKAGNEINLMDIISNDEESVLNNLIVADSLKHINKVYSTTLTAREQRILALRYGLYGTDELTQKDIAKLLGISRSYVSRIEKKALLKLRSALIL